MLGTKLFPCCGVVPLCCRGMNDEQRRWRPRGGGGGGGHIHKLVTCPTAAQEQVWMIYYYYYYYWCAYCAVLANCKWLRTYVRTYVDVHVHKTATIQSADVIPQNRHKSKMPSICLSVCLSVYVCLWMEFFNQKRPTNRRGRHRYGAPAMELPDADSSACLFLFSFVTGKLMMQCHMLSSAERFSLLQKMLETPKKEKINATIVRIPPSAFYLNVSK